jgi:uncharacterized protein
MRIGVVSDTHGRVHMRVLELFAGVDRILHAGDVGNDDVLALLETVAPVTAVRGNTDHYPEASRLPDEARVDMDGARILVVHDESRWLAGQDEANLGALDVLVAGHTHQPRAETLGGLLHLNPGSASSGGYGRLPTVAFLEVGGARPQARIVPLWEAASL